MIIKFCLNLAAKSSSAYRDLWYDITTGTGIIVLPSLKTIKIISNQQEGLILKFINKLAEKTVSISEIEKCVIILFDEMKIQENLVRDKHSGELIGFVDLSDIKLHLKVFKS